MKKETIIAIFFGVAFGALVALFLLAKNKEFQLTKIKTIAPTKKANNKPKNIAVEAKSLEILDPQDSIIVNSKSVKIEGKTAKGALLIIQSPIKDVAFKTENDQFSIDFPLALGENVIKITAYTKDAQIRSQEKELHIYNLDEQL